MLNRRQFCFALASLSSLFAVPAVPREPVAALPPEPLDPALFPPAARDTVAGLEDFLRRHPSAFSWHIHNELRHLYHTVSLEHSFYHANAILGHLPMDRYTLQVLSEWQLEQDPGYAIAALWAKVARYPQFAFLGAACLVQIGDLLAGDDQRAAAGQVYRVVAAARAPAGQAALDNGLEAYRQLAQYRLGFAPPRRKSA